MYTLALTEPEMAFFRELFQSQIAVTLDKVDLLALLKQKVMSAAPEAASADIPTLIP